MTQATELQDEFSPEKMLEDIRKERKENAAKRTIGTRFTVPRTGVSLDGQPKEGIDTILYRPASGEAALPVLFNMHGGAWIGGDAVYMESFCQMMAERLPALVVNINYRKADERPFPYAIEEAADCVCYFTEHAKEYGIDTDLITVGGHSAGAQLAAGTAVLLGERGISLAAQMLVYPCVQMDQNADELMYLIGPMLFPDSQAEYNAAHRYASPLAASDEVLKSLPPAIFVLCGPDDLRPQGIAYAKRLMELAVPVRVREFIRAEHGFLEVNRPDYPDGDSRKNQEQAEYARQAEDFLAGELQAVFSERNRARERQG
nr:alpha/beta hydrolase [uncultured Acetatifactor sp.]